MNQNSPVSIVCWIGIADLLLFGLLMYFVKTPRLIDDLDEARTAAERLIARVKQAEADAAALRQERDALMAEVARLNAENADLEVKLADVTAKYHEAEARYRKAQADLDEYKKDKDSLAKLKAQV